MILSQPATKLHRCVAEIELEAEPRDGRRPSEVMDRRQGSAPSLNSLDPH